MPGLNKNRKRPVTIAFRVTAQEAQRINQRVKISGLSRRKYFMNTFLGQKIEISGGCFESNRLASELEKQMQELRAYMEEVFTDYNDINEDTRMQLEMINQTLAELQVRKKVEEKPRNPIGFRAYE